MASIQSLTFKTFPKFCITFLSLGAAKHSFHLFLMLVQDKWFAIFHLCIGGVWFPECSWPACGILPCCNLLLWHCEWFLSECVFLERLERTTNVVPESLTCSMKPRMCCCLVDTILTFDCGTCAVRTQRGDWYHLTSCILMKNRNASMIIPTVDVGQKMQIFI